MKNFNIEVLTSQFNALIKPTQFLHEKADVEGNVCAIKPADKFICWNCDETGHRYHDCLKPHRIFCYGCGITGVYKPFLAKCKSLQENSRQYIRKLPKVHVACTSV